MTADLKITNSRDLKNLRKFYRKAPFKFGAVMNATLNTLAFTTRTNIVSVLDKHLVIRNRKFVEGSVKVNKARGGRHVSSVGSIERKRFSGWEEQQTGKKPKSNRSPTMAARMGNFKRKMSAKARMKKQLNPLKITDIKIGERKLRTLVLLRRAKKKKRPILIRRIDEGKVRINKRMSAGLYMFQRGKLMRTQTFGKSHDPKQFDWIGQAVKMTGRTTAFRETFAREFVRLMKRQELRVR